MSELPIDERCGRVLVVDDDPVVRESLSEELGERFEVESVDSGEVALERLATGGFDALVSDVRMPGMGGVALVEQATSLDPQLVRVFLTGYGDEEVSDCARSSGAFKLRKPWGDELELILTHAIEHRRRIDGLRDELEDYVTVASESHSQEPQSDVREVFTHLEQSLRSLPWVEDVEVTAEPPTLHSVPPGASDWMRIHPPRLLPGGLDRIEQEAEMGGRRSTRHRVRVVFHSERRHAHKLVELALHHAADALRMRELNDEIRLRARQLEAARREMMERDRLAALGAMAASVAHDIRSPLAVLRANHQYLSERLSEPGRSDGEIESALEDDHLAVTAIQQVLDSLRSLSMEPGASEAVKLSHAARSAARLLRRQLADAGVTVEFDVGDEPMALATVGEVAQILINLITNAAQASPEDSVLLVRTEARGANVVIQVEDEGQGVAEGKRDEIFRPFHTTKEHGMGLGLAISRQMARRHGGDLRFVETVRGGACFELVLPQASEAADAAE